MLANASRCCADKPALDEPLLGEHQDEDSSGRQNFEPSSERPSSSGSSAVVPHSINRLDWEHLAQRFVESCQALGQSLWGEAVARAWCSYVEPAQLLSCGLCLQRPSRTALPASEGLRSTPRASPPCRSSGCASCRRRWRSCTTQTAHSIRSERACQHSG